jgi:hypothetical protein
LLAKGILFHTKIATKRERQIKTNKIFVRKAHLLTILDIKNAGRAQN